MNVVAIVMLGMAGALSTYLWWYIDPRRHAIGIAAAVAALALPALFLATAAIFAVTGDKTSDFERAAAVILGTISAVTGGGVIATGVLRIADRFAGNRPPPPPPPPRDDPSTATPAASPGLSVTPGLLGPTGVTTTSAADLGRPMPAAASARAGSSGGTAAPGHQDGDTVSNPDTLRGGAWIGALERLAIVATLLTRWPEGLAVILAVKGLGRYPELRRPAAAERFIIGTLASALWAIACVGVIVILTNQP